MTNQNPTNQKEPEDIFSNIEPTKPPEATKREALKEKAGMPMQEPAIPSSLPKRRRILGIVLLIVIVILFVGAGIFIFGNDIFKKNKNDNQNIATGNTANNLNTPVIVNIANINKAADADNDGLSDEEENSLGTNLNNRDTDGDGLFDREEVKVYKTDPKNPDTDGDGVKDGDEVKNGDNPNGPGKLTDLTNEINKINK